MKYLWSKIGTIPISATQPLEIKTLNALKFLMLRLVGQVTITGAGSAVPVYGPADLIKGLSLTINGQQGPFSFAGRDLLFKNLKDWSRLPTLVVPGAATNAAGVPFQVDLNVDFSFPHMFGVDAKGNAVGPDLTIFYPKEGNTYLLNVAWGTVADIITGGTVAWTAGQEPRIEVWAQEARGLAPLPNKYNGSYVKTAIFAGANVAEEVTIPYGTLLNELQIQSFDANGVPSDAIITNIRLENGTAETFIDSTWAALREKTEFRNPLLSPLTLPVGFNVVDLSPENSYNDLLPTVGMKELKLVFAVSAAGFARVLVNELRDGID